MPFPGLLWMPKLRRFFRPRPLLLADFGGRMPGSGFLKA